MCLLKKFLRHTNSHCSKEKVLKTKINKEESKSVKKVKPKVLNNIEDLDNNIAIHKASLSKVPIDNLIPQKNHAYRINLNDIFLKDTPDNLEKVEGARTDPINRKRQKRWGRQNDKKLFEKIREYETKKYLKLKDLMKIQLSHHTFKHPVVKMLARELGWGETSKMLLERIQTLCKKNFSTREIKALKNIIKKEYKYRDVDHEAIFYHFPGKTMSELIRISNKICNIKSKKKLCSFMSS